MINSQKNIHILIIICLVLGFILSRQFFLHKQLKSETTPERESELAVEVSRLIKGNKDLVLERDKLQAQYTLILKNSEDKKSNKTTLQNSIEQYKLILGKVPVEGPGVTIQYDDTLDVAQLTDLVNALRNIGAEAISINGKRITPNTGWDMKTFWAPYKIQAIGDRNVLEESLKRPGGVMENVGFSGTVTSEKKIYLPAIK